MLDVVINLQALVDVKILPLDLYCLQGKSDVSMDDIYCWCDVVHSQSLNDGN